MAEYAYPKALTGMQDTQWSAFLLNLAEDGATTDAAFTPSANGAGMTVSLAPGVGFVQGVLTGDEDVADLSIGASHATLARIDTIVKQLNRSATPVIQTVVKAGAPLASPTPPTLTQNPTGIWEWPVADVLVPAGATSITPDKVTDRRTFSGMNVGVWSTAQRPAAPRLGKIGYNTTLTRLEVYVGGGSPWANLSPENLSASAITSGTFAAARIPTIGDSKISDLDWGKLTGKPSTFTPSTHTLDSHSGTLSVTNGGTGATSAAGARTALGITPAAIGAATSSHTHSTSNISGLDSTLSSVQSDITALEDKTIGVVQIYVQSSQPTGAKTGALWFW